MQAYPTDTTIQMLHQWLLDTQCIQFTGRTAHAGKLVKPHDVFDRCVKENPVWWFANYRYVMKGSKAGTKSEVWYHFRDYVVMPALLKLRESLGKSIDELPCKAKNETRVNGKQSVKALAGWEWNVPKGSLSTTASTTTPSISSTATPPITPSPPYEEQSVPCDADRCPPFDISEGIETDYAALMANESHNPTVTTGGVAQKNKGRKRKRVDRPTQGAITRSRG